MSAIVLAGDWQATMRMFTFCRKYKKAVLLQLVEGQLRGSSAQ
jgi:hypothetical protein